MESVSKTNSGEIDREMLGKNKIIAGEDRE